MEVTVGTRLGPYEIVSRIGAGGMGEVWRARDTRLDRSVAIKVLSTNFAGQADLRARFDREARTISQLNHPNICTLYDLGHEDGIDYLVMELLEGDTLADRIEKGPIPLPDLLRIGAQIADALARAHRQGITHRDLKPANVMLTKSGAKLLDFGLAKTLTSSRPSATPDDATQHRPLTQEGTVLGTFQYMAPEQLAGEEADARSDLFALGAVLYEMATGATAFTGKNRTSLIANILGTTPRPISELQPTTPPSLERLIQRCLAKDPDDRWQSAADVADELKWIAQGGSQSSSGVSLPAPRKRERWRRVLIGGLGLAAVAAISLLVNERLTPEPSFIVPIAPPPGRAFNAVGNTAGPASISPDGRFLIFSAEGSGSDRNLWLYAMETGEQRQLVETSGAMFPFWSPDSKSVGYFADGKLKRINVLGAGSAAICDAPGARGGTWGPNDVILFSPNTTSAIFRVSAAGGSPVPVTSIQAKIHTTHRWPEFLPDGKRFVYVAASHNKPAAATNGLYLASLDGKENRQLNNVSASAIYSSGCLFYVRDDILFAQSVSKNMAVEGDPRIVARGAIFDVAVWKSSVSVSRDGTLLFHTGPGAPRSELTWVDRKGSVLSTVGPPEVYRDCRLSPDGRRLLTTIGDPTSQIWIHDLERDVRRRFGVDGDWSLSPLWSSDGTAIHYVALRDGKWCVVSAPSLGGKAARTLFEGGNSASRVTGASPDGKWIVADLDGNSVIIPVSGGKPERLFATELTRSATFSPDGNWIAYVSNENGTRSEVFVTSARDRATKWQVSNDGGTHPVWRADGKELFYLTAADRTLTSVAIEISEGEPEISRPRELFSALFESGQLDRPYSVAGDGQRIIINISKIGDASGLTLVKNWINLASRSGGAR